MMSEKSDGLESPPKKAGSLRTEDRTGNRTNPGGTDATIALASAAIAFGSVNILADVFAAIPSETARIAAISVFMFLAMTLTFAAGRRFLHPSSERGGQA